MQIFPLFEGSFSVDTTKKFIPFDPAIHQAKDRPASLFIYVQPFLVKTASELLLFDTGLGYSTEQGQLVVHENIRKAGFDPDDVTRVLMSHLHFDHSGGMVDEAKGVLSFPHAEYVVQQGEWESAYSKPSRSYRTEIFDIVQRSGNLRLIEGSGRLSDEITYELTGGHCEFHQVFLVERDDERVFFGGDILPEPEQLLRKFAAKYDFDGRLAMQLRQEYGERAAAGDWTCLYYHAKSEPLSKVRYEKETFQIVQVS